MNETQKASALLGEALLGAIRSAVREEIRAALRIGETAAESDRLLDADEAAKVLGISTDWIYRHARQLPFTRRLGPRMLRFSHRGIQEWMARKKI